jgi:ABC-type multidrug transport system ATPase subunit
MPTQTAALQLHSLTKRYGTRRAVDDLSLTVERGQLFGFLGLNGAGKTTTIRMMTGLVKPDSGTVQLFGETAGRFGGVLNRIGFHIEGAAFYPYLSGADNLRVLCDIRRVSVDRIPVVMKQVGLSERARDRFNTYSTGMRARLGIAAALLHDPDLLILDEPANGLDPQGMVELRALLRDLVGRHGKTVFLSSHQLAEVEHTCDHVAIIDNGRLITAGAVRDLLKGAGLRITVNDVQAAINLLQSYQPTPAGEDAISIQTDREGAADAIHRLTANGIRIYAAEPIQQTLEDYFLTHLHHDPIAAR